MKMEVFSAEIHNQCETNDTDSVPQTLPKWKHSDMHTHRVALSEACDLYNQHLFDADSQSGNRTIPIMLSPWNQKDGFVTFSPHLSNQNCSVSRFIPFQLKKYLQQKTNIKHGI